MIYRLKELKGDTIAVPQLVFSKLGIAEEYNVRVALRRNITSGLLCMCWPPA